jgi:ADP-ribosyl-[dinitrogen reductase] hydrolase
MIGMAIADSLGHQFEFLPVQETPNPADKSIPYFHPPTAECPGGTFQNPQNAFHLQSGQWTDDTSMGLCMADSLLSCGGYCAWNMRVWFWNWWKNGVDNAFRIDSERRRLVGQRRSLSVGLGGNIAKSIVEVGFFEEKEVKQSVQKKKRTIPPPHCTLATQDAGNGSLMRLSPVPIYFHSSLSSSSQYSFDSSLTTHPGFLAAEACAFLGYLITRCIHRKEEESAFTAAQFLDIVRDEYLERLEGEVVAKNSGLAISAKNSMIRLLRSEEADNSKERCWNWRMEDLGIWKTLSNRGKEYNGYPVMPGYFGSFSMDGLSMALHSLYHTSDFNAAICRVVNLCGDADSTGAICGQIAGAFYSISSINPEWRRQVKVWDEGEIELRGILLYYAADIDRLTNVTWPVSNGAIGDDEEFQEFVPRSGKNGESELQNSGNFFNDNSRIFLLIFSAIATAAIAYFLTSK